MPVVSGSIRIAAAPADVFALSQSYALRRRWDPFVRDIRFLHGAADAGPGVEVWVRAWNGLQMTVRYTAFRPPESVAMSMVKGPRLFRRFAGAWAFAPDGAGGMVVTFRYSFA